jgi:RNA polymerase sigma-70 factor (sigma-E family)
VEKIATVAQVSNESGLLERLYRAHVPRNVRIAFLIVGDEEVARELAHDAYLRVTTRLHRLRDPEAFGAYMTRTVVNLSKRHRERRSRERRYTETHGPPVATLEFESDLTSRDELLSALRSLPHRQRAALVLRFYADMPESEIAHVMDCPIGTVKSLVSRGLAALRERMKEAG